MAQLLSNLSIGAKVKFGKHQVNSETAQDIIWTIVAKNHKSTPAYPSNSVTLHASNILDLRCFDAKEPNNVNASRASYGNNCYGVSNMHTWLNSRANAGAWYSAQHSADQAPDSSDVVNHGTEHASRPGFLNLFSEDEYNAILDTTIRTVLPTVDGSSTESFTAKVFLPSTTEVGLANEGYAEGSAWGYYTSNAARVAYLTNQAWSNTKASYKPFSASSSWEWWLRTPDRSTSNYARRVTSDGSLSYALCNGGYYGVRPALNLPSALMVSDSTDSDGCYTVVWNVAPSAPPTINVPTAVYGGKNLTISWGNSTDSDGNLAGYTLERSYDGRSFTPIAKGSILSYIDTITHGWETVAYRVCAFDSDGATSAYTTSATRTVINNQAPVISGSDGYLGTKSEGFSQTYTITDADGDKVTVTETIDGVAIRSYTATLGAIHTFAVTGLTWLKQTNGSHTMTITATDAFGHSSLRTFTFIKSVNSFTIENDEPYDSVTMPTRIKIAVTRNIPVEATFTVLVCNNGFDSSPTWEDATSSVVSGLVHVFENTVKTADMWGVVIRVIVERGDAEGACYVSQIGGNFE